MGSSQSPNPQFLIVDDHQEDVFMLMWALEKVGMAHFAHSLGNGMEAISFLKGCVANGRKLPSLVLIHVDMPVMNGYEVLDWIQSQTALGRLHIRMLSTAPVPADVSRPGARGSIRHWRKPSLWEEHVELALEIKALLAATPTPQKN